MSILVTGGTGFLGGHVTQCLRDLGHDPISVGSSEADLVSQRDTYALFVDTRPKVVYHLAAQVGGIGANREHPADYWYYNLMMGMNVLEECRHFEVQKLIMVGTVCSYPKYTCAPFNEDDLWEGYPDETNAPYGIAKKSLLVGAQAYREQFGLNTIFLMPANMYGPGDNFSGRGGHVIADMIKKFHGKQRPAELWGDGSATRDFLYVEDAAKGVCKAAELYNGSWPVNLGTGREINMTDLAHLIKANCGFRGGFYWNKQKPNGQPSRVLNTSRAKALFGWEATTSLEQGLLSTVKWYRENVLPTTDKADKLEV